MVNLEHKLTVDDLIVEYMMYKVKNGYEPKFSSSEFINFLYFFEIENRMKVENSLYKNEELFQRFFERKAESDWSTVNGITQKKEIKPHMEIEYSEKDNDYIISANNKLSDFDKSIINTYFISEKQVSKIRNIINEYLSDQPKRKIDETTEIEEKDLMIGKYLSAEIITQIWLSHISKQIEYQMWPKQCTDINKYLFDVDLAEIIGIKSIKEELIKLYNVLSRRIAILYKQDKHMKVSSFSNSYLARANYELLIQGYEDIIKTTFGPYKKSLDIDLSTLTFKESHELDGVYFEDDDPEVRTTTISVGNNNAKKLVRNIEKK